MVDKSRGDDGGRVGGGAVKLRQSYLVHGGRVCVCVCACVLGAGSGVQRALQSFNEPGNSLVSVCQRSIFLSLFLRQSNQCLSRSPFALMPRETPPETRPRVSHQQHRLKHGGPVCDHLMMNISITSCVFAQRPNQCNMTLECKSWNSSGQSEGVMNANVDQH